MSAILIPGILANNRFMQPVDQYYEWYKVNINGNLANLIRDNQKTLETIRMLVDLGLGGNILYYWNTDMGCYKNFVSPNYFINRVFDFSNLSYYPIIYQNTASLKPLLLTQGIDFDGTDDCFAISGGISSVVNSFSFGGWVKPNKTITQVTESQTGAGGTIGQNYIMYPLLDATHCGAGLSVGTDGIQVFEHFSGYLPCHAKYTASLGNNWHHVMIVYNNKQALIYLDGSLVRTGLTSAMSNVYCTLGLALNNTYGLWKGSFNDISLFDKALSATEVSNLYNMTASKYA